MATQNHQALQRAGRAEYSHTVRVKYKVEAIQVVLNGKPYIDVKHADISGAGEASVWTKEDSITLFDDVSTSATP